MGSASARRERRVYLSAARPGPSISGRSGGVEGFDPRRGGVSLGCVPGDRAVVSVALELGGERHVGRKPVDPHAPVGSGHGGALASPERLGADEPDHDRGAGERAPAEDHIHVERDRRLEGDARRGRSAGIGASAGGARARRRPVRPGGRRSRRRRPRRLAPRRSARRGEHRAGKPNDRALRCRAPRPPRMADPWERGAQSWHCPARAPACGPPPHRSARAAPRAARRVARPRTNATIRSGAPPAEGRAGAAGRRGDGEDGAREIGAAHDHRETGGDLRSPRRRGPRRPPPPRPTKAAATAILGVGDVERDREAPRRDDQQSMVAVGGALEVEPRILGIAEDRAPRADPELKRSRKTVGLSSAAPSSARSHPRDLWWGRPRRGPRPPGGTADSGARRRRLARARGANRRRTPAAPRHGAAPSRRARGRSSARRAEEEPPRQGESQRSSAGSAGLSLGSRNAPTVVAIPGTPAGVSSITT